MPPRPGGVAIATMVSSVANTASPRGARRSRRFREMTTVLRNASPMLSDVSVVVFGHRQVHDAARVRD